MNDPKTLSGIELAPTLQPSAPVSDPLLAALGNVRRIERVG